MPLTRLRTAWSPLAIANTAHLQITTAVSLKTARSGLARRDVFSVPLHMTLKFTAGKGVNVTTLGKRTLFRRDEEQTKMYQEENVHLSGKFVRENWDFRLLSCPVVENNISQHENGYLATTCLEWSTSQPGCACCYVLNIKWFIVTRFVNQAPPDNMQFHQSAFLSTYFSKDFKVNKQVFATKEGSQLFQTT